MSSDAIAQKYSGALFETSEQAGNSIQIATELSEIAKAFSEDSVVSFFSSPYNTADNKLAAAKSALEGKCSPMTFNFISTVVEKERVGYLSEISLAFQKLVLAKGGETEGILYVAGEISSDFKSQVEAKLSSSLNKKVKLSVEKDPTLLTGFKVSVGGWTLDDSGSFHLNKIKDEISKRGI